MKVRAPFVVRFWSILTIEFLPGNEADKIGENCLNYLNGKHDFSEQFNIVTQVLKEIFEKNCHSHNQG